MISILHYDRAVTLYGRCGNKRLNLNGLTFDVKLCEIEGEIFKVTCFYLIGLTFQWGILKSLPFSDPSASVWDQKSRFDQLAISFLCYGDRTHCVPKIPNE